MDFVVVLMLTDSPKDCGPRINKRKWKEEEDDALIEALKDLRNLRPDCPNQIKKLSHMCRHFKGIHNVVHDMVVGSCTSGFGWDPETKSVVAEKEVWKAYEKSHPRANDWRCKLCPYYENLYIIFGKDLASRKDAQGPEEMEDEVNEEGENEVSSKKDVPESLSTQEPSGVEGSSGKSENLGKWVRASDNLVKRLSEVASVLEREIRLLVVTSVELSALMSEKRSKLNEEFANLVLTIIERHRAARKIAFELESR
ncbi:LOW QUALITY PROTEIN: hypothetical protein Cgig2_018965 [Carnegiea gigantea]|uniref:Myb/SANT-like domain-containing protein n=1 Tax=Carnegiea gigantea TaxID=171969 RepID=A0A9Q1K2D5_9CARY|nr:LOW QUALITY PROTEIN: hypothetical protein Cgig2_018965 [Carnegiea gigantea]